MGTPFAFSGALQLPGDSGLPPDSIPINFSSVFSSEADYVFNLTGAGTQTVPFGTISGAGCVGLLIKVDPIANGQPIYIKVNGSSTGAIELNPSGFIAYGNPQPTAGITGLVITYSAPCVVRVWVLG